MHRKCLLGLKGATIRRLSDAAFSQSAREYFYRKRYLPRMHNLH